MIDIRVPDIGDFKDVPIIEIFVKPGENVNVDDPLISLAAATHRPCAELLAALDDEADLSGAGTWRGSA